MANTDLNSALSLKEKATEAWKELNEGHKKANILVCGKTGVGKSTLINAVFRDDLATTGVGKPVTQNLEAITKEGIPLNIFDTKGLELNDYAHIKDEIINEVKRRRGKDGEDYIHLAWLCLSQTGSRIEDAELQLANELNKLGVSVVVVITKCISLDDANFLETAKSEFKGVCRDIIPLLAKAVEFEGDEGQTLQFPERGINELIDVSSQLIPETQKRAFANALNIKETEALEKKKEEAEKIVTWAGRFAGAIGLTPIPFSDAVPLVIVQATMLTKISSLFGMSVTKGDIVPIISMLTGVTAGTVAGKTVVAGVLKFFPFAGAVGSTLSAAVARKVTRTMGDIYNNVLFSIVSSGKVPTLDEAISLLKHSLTK